MITTERAQEIARAVGTYKDRPQTARVATLAFYIANDFKEGEVVSQREIISKVGVTFATVSAACEILTRGGYLSERNNRCYRTNKPAPASPDAIVDRPAEAQIYTRPDGQSFVWFPVGSVLDRNKKHIAVLLSCRCPGKQCAGCIFARAPFEVCVAARRDSFGDCISWCRGDGERVIFHEIGTPIDNRDVRAANIAAGLEKFF